ncbi:hypothetical protein M0802_005249 [Mischocyttarus mexicanus]|nr:hypothetical protein M0802_005249 [Mischocyttarus mexicanus]
MCLDRIRLLSALNRRPCVRSPARPKKDRRRCLVVAVVNSSGGSGGGGGGGDGGGGNSSGGDTDDDIFHTSKDNLIERNEVQRHPTESSPTLFKLGIHSEDKKLSHDIVITSSSFSTTTVSTLPLPPPPPPPSYP